MPEVKTVITGGGLIIEILVSYFFKPVAESNLRAWIEGNKLTVTSLMDPPGSGTPTLDAFGIRETCFIVDLTTMKIVKKINGSVSGSGDSSIKQLMPELAALVAK
jgi:hypothetical protein